jgi:hypothetical protein
LNYNYKIHFEVFKWNTKIRFFFYITAFFLNAFSTFYHPYTTHYITNIYKVQHNKSPTLKGIVTDFNLNLLKTL